MKKGLIIILANMFVILSFGLAFGEVTEISVEDFLRLTTYMPEIEGISGLMAANFYDPNPLENAPVVERAQSGEGHKKPDKDASETSEKIPQIDSSNFAIVNLKIKRLRVSDRDLKVRRDITVALKTALADLGFHGTSRKEAKFLIGVTFKDGQFPYKIPSRIATVPYFFSEQVTYQDYIRGDIWVNITTYETSGHWGVTQIKIPARVIKVPQLKIKLKIIDESTKKVVWSCVGSKYSEFWGMAVWKSNQMIIQEIVKQKFTDISF